MSEEGFGHVYCGGCTVLLRLPNGTGSVRCPRCGRVYDQADIYPYGLEVGERVAASTRANSSPRGFQSASALLSSGGNAPLLSTCLDDSTWTRPAKWTTQDLDDLVKALGDLPIRWPQQGGEWVLTMNPQWLQTIIARSEYLRSELRFAPDWPVTYADGEYTISLVSHRDRWVRACVVSLCRHEACVAAFDPVNWDVAFHESSAGVLCCGLAIALFTDVALGIPKHPEARPGGPPYNSKATSAGLLLFPSDEAPFIRTDGDTLPEPHRVRGFIRRLPAGVEPNPQQVSLAPSFVREKMGVRDTYVRPHVRGSATQQAILSALRRTTNLRDARAGLLASESAHG